MTHFENKFVFKDALCPYLKCNDIKDYTTLLADLSPIDFDIVRLSN